MEVKKYVYQDGHTSHEITKYTDDELEALRKAPDVHQWIERNATVIGTVNRANPAPRPPDHRFSEEDRPKI